VAEDAELTGDLGGRRTLLDERDDGVDRLEAGLDASAIRFVHMPDVVVEIAELNVRGDAPAQQCALVTFQEGSQVGRHDL